MYYYRLGHIPQLSLAELSLTGVTIIQSNKEYALGDNPVDIQKLGAIRYIASVYKGNYGASLPEIFNSHAKHKFVGIVQGSYEKNELIKLAKSAGAKKVALLTKEPTIGDWKRSNLVVVETLVDGDVTTLCLEDYYDSDSLAKLEDSLPHHDMQRGQVQLKLARSLTSLAGSRRIWDPFCGIGRNVVASIDLLEACIVSDIDEKAVKQAVDNIAVAQKFRSTSCTVDQLVSAAETAVVEGVEISSFAVVSEGWLGTNFRASPTREHALKSWGTVYNAYSKCFSHWKSLEIETVVICTPFFPHLPELTELIEQEFCSCAENAGYHIESLYEQRSIQYSRPQSFVGHLIFKARKV